MFKERICAWANGPVVYELFKSHQGKFMIGRNDLPSGSIQMLGNEQRATIDAVLHYYGDKTPQWLSDLTHMERPWKIARKGLSAGEMGTEEITLESMGKYYEEISSKK